LIDAITLDNITSNVRLNSFWLEQFTFARLGVQDIEDLIPHFFQRLGDVLPVMTAR
jgi:hypothetical protein